MAGKLGLKDIFGGTEDEKEKDYYEILNCNENSTEDQITAEYRILAKRFHPDKNPGDDTCLNDFKLIQEARDTLMDPEARANYDRWRRSQISIPFKAWKAVSGRTTLHWAKPKSQCMLDNSDSLKEPKRDLRRSSEPSRSSGCTEEDDMPYNVKWGIDARMEYRASQKDPSIFRRFRNYQL